jgi:hypothetical protein
MVSALLLTIVPLVHKMKRYFVLAVFIIATLPFITDAQSRLSFFSADSELIRYTGRVDFSNAKLPRFWQPGVYVTAAFSGPVCEVLLNDEILWGKSHNYVSVSIDGGDPIRVQTKQRSDTLRFMGLGPGKHSIVICKSTEAGIGYLEFAGLRCERLLPPPPKPARRIEFIGNSITCGTGSDLSMIPCDSGQWYDQHNAYESYGPQTARNLNAEWHLSSVSGIGLIRSCCDMKITMPDVYDKVNMRENSGAWDFTRFRPDAVTIALGQNDGQQDSVAFTSAYVAFIAKVRSYYPDAEIVCLTSPMANDALSATLKNYLAGAVNEVRANGDMHVHKYYFSRRYNSGCGDHPDLQQHGEIARELTAFLKTIMHW